VHAASFAAHDRLKATASAAKEIVARWEGRFAGIEALPPLSALYGLPIRPPGERRRLRVTVDEDTAAELAKLAIGREFPLALLAFLVTVAGLVNSRSADRADLLTAMPAADASAPPRLLPVRVVLDDAEMSGMQVLAEAADEVRQILTYNSFFPDHVAAFTAGDRGPVLSVCVEPEQVCPTAAELVVVASRDDVSGVLIEVDFDISRVTEALALRVSEQLAALSMGLFGNPHRAVSALCLPATRPEHVPGPAGDSPDPTLHARLAEFGTQAPDRIAVVNGERRVTFGQLEHAARAVAQRLADSGVRGGERVALLLPRGELPMVTIAGIFKAAATAVPVDIGYPADRVGYILADAGVTAVVTEPGSSRLVPGSFTGPVVVLGDAAELARESGPQRSGAPIDAPAYVIYTSGTTGRPKGVEVSHTALAFVCRMYYETLRLDRFDPAGLQLASVSFDVFFGEMCRSLYNGAALVVCPDEDRADPAAIVDLVVKHDVRMLDCTPGLAGMIADEIAARPEPPGSLRVVVVGSDAWPAAACRRVRRLLPADVEVYNAYGVTEATIDSTYLLIPPGGPGAGTAYVPIGVPYPGLAAYVLDSSGRPMPDGLVGELYLGGPTVAIGYVGNLELTAERFPPDRFAGRGRLYRTGDMVRRLHSGELEFLGRRDQQVKVRGHRIETGEVEAVLTSHADISDTAVAAWPDGADGTRLVAYVVAGPDGWDVRQVRGYCVGILPPYMIPDIFVELPRLPLSPNGKVDRAALPSPEIDQAASSSPYLAPRSALERVIAECWADILGVERVGVLDDFFERGGHSLLASRMIGRLRTLTGREVPLRAVFEEPTVAGLAARFTAAAAARPPVTVADHPDLPPLSSAQVRMWFNNRAAPTDAQDNLPLVVRLHGELNRSALTTALGDVVRRHESLRTVFPELHGVPVQRILAAGDAEPPIVVREFPGADVAETVTEAVRWCFDLTEEPPFRAWLLCVGDNEHVLVLLFHHIAMDGWSEVPFWRDVAAAYQARCEGRAPGWAELKVQYGDYALWQRELLGQESDPGSLIGRQLAFWRRALAGAPEELALPFDRPRPAMASHQGAALYFEIPAELHQELARLARASGATLFMVLHAGLVVALSGLGAGSDIPLGVAVAGRDDPVLDDLVGFFVNTLVLRVDVSGNPSFRQLVERLRVVDLAAFAHADLPFERLVEVLNPARSLSRHPLFQVMLVHQNNEEADYQLHGLRTVMERPAKRSARFDLMLTFNERPKGLSGEVEYPTDLFDTATAEQIVQMLLRVLRSAAADPDAAISSIDILQPEERASVLSWSCGAQRPELAELSVLGMIDNQVCRTPEAIAVLADGVALSFREVSERSDRIADLLLNRGADMERRVVVCLSRTTNLVCCFLAVLKTGAVYVPVDPALPAERIAYILADAAPTVILTDTASVSKLPGSAVAQVVVDRADSALGGPSSTPAASSPGPKTAGFLLYTSGSTGRPKGVGLTLRAMANLAAWHREFLPGGAGTRTAQFASMGFDVSVLEMLSCLTTGKTLVIAPDLVRKSPSGLAHWLSKNEIHEIIIPNTVVQMLCETADAEGVMLPELRHVIQSGEPLALTNRLRAFFSRRNCRLHNGYGPTEAHRTTVSDMPSDPADWDGGAPIGRPIHNARTYVLDDFLRLVAPGVIGEVYIAGAGLARGYTGRPGLTAERFVADPLGSAGSRMYRTGDLARWDRLGRLVIAGRADLQLKVRGFRIEPGEVESVLASYPEVVQAVVRLHTDARSERRLVAWVVPVSGLAPSPETLREFAGRFLPEYMIPSAFTPVEALPVTANGKIDYQALPEPVFACGGGAARTPQEAMLCEVFSEVLGMEGVGVDDDFFHLGGHSLLSARLASRARAETGIDVGIKDLFEAPTPARLARRIDDLREQGAVARPLIQRAERPFRF
jgi:amino acid adenylation domain-containing protein